MLAQIPQWVSVRGSHLSSVNQDTLAEIVRRLERLDSTLRRLVEINAELCATAALQVSYDPESETLSAQMGNAVSSVKLNRANPDVPIKFGPTSSLAAYRSGSSIKNESARTIELKVALEGDLEQYYYNAHRVLKLAQSLPGCRNLKCKEIVVVRNKLIEHSDHGEIYSFGFGTAGPVVRPFARPGRGWNDSGLLPNTEAFIAALCRSFAR